MNTAIIARGWPGSGKSYLVNQLISSFPAETFVCSADHYFLNAEGIYNFKLELLGNAHGYCRDKFVKALEAKIPLVILDNTNLDYSSCRDYMEWAAIADYRILLLESKAPWKNNVDECFKRNSHGVPLDLITSMKQKYQPNEIVAQFALENLGVKVEYNIPYNFKEKRYNIVWE